MKSEPTLYKVPLHPCNYELFQFKNRVGKMYYLVMAEARKNAQRFEISVHYHGWRGKPADFQGTLKHIELLKWADLSFDVKLELKTQNPELFMQFETAYLYQLQAV